jgi:hypothetical protein
MFRRDGARELSDEVCGNYNFNRAYCLNSLKTLCEHGAGMPYAP